MKIYATVNDLIEWAPNPKGGITRLGVKGDWKNIEGEKVVSDIEVSGPEDFAAKSTAIVTLWPGAVVRFMQEKRA
jgi:hypothetical protein